jgi:hypothetical protein
MSKMLQSLPLDALASLAAHNGDAQKGGHELGNSAAMLAVSITTSLQSSGARCNVQIVSVWLRCDHARYNIERAPLSSADTHTAARRPSTPLVSVRREAAAGLPILIPPTTPPRPPSPPAPAIPRHLLIECAPICSNSGHGDTVKAP